MSIKETLTRILNAINTLQNRDYIIEEGSTGDWNYRKWANGTAECWRVWYSGSFAPTGQVGGFYYRVTNAENLPTDLFVGTPAGHFDLTYWGTGVFWGNVRNVTTSTYRLTLFRNDNASSEGWGALSFIGNWK